VAVTIACPRGRHIVDKILKGANPATLPVEQPSKFQVTVNSKTAQALGFSLSPILLAQIDEGYRLNRQMTAFAVSGLTGAPSESRRPRAT
jgi:hypothetical protein